MKLWKKMTAGAGAAMLAFALLPSGVMAEEEPEAVREEEEFKEAQAYKLYVGGEQVTDDNRNDILNDGTASYDPASNTLTLNHLDGVSGMTMSNMIYAEDMDLRIEGSGDIYPAGDFSQLGGIEVWNGSLTLAGDFEITADRIGVYVNTGNLTLESGTVKVAAGSDGLHVHNGFLTICEGISRLEVFAAEDGTSDAVYGQNGITIADDLVMEVPEGGSVNGEHVVNADGTRAANVVITPKSKYTVSYDANGGSGEMASEIVYSDEEYTLPVCVFTTPAGMSFAGWQSEDGTVYAEGDPAELAGDCTFTARWKLGYELSVGGIKVTPDNMNDILGDGKASFNPETKTLTLNEVDGFTDEDGYDLIYAKDTDLRIEGSGKICLTGGSDRTKGIEVLNGSLTLAGDFEITGGTYGIYVGEGNVMIESGTITVTGGQYEGIRVFKGAMEIGAGITRLESSGPDGALYAGKGITVDDALLIQTPQSGEYEGADHVVIVAKRDIVFSGHRLVLSGSLGLQFEVEFPEGLDTELSYVTFTVNGAEQKVNTNDTEHYDDYAVYTCYLTTLQMAETIEAVFHYGSQEVTHTYSLEDYFSYFEEHASDFTAGTLNLIKAVADYGYYAQPYLASVNRLNGRYRTITKHYTEAYDFDAVKDAVSGYAFAKAIGDSAVENASYKLALDSDTAVTIIISVPSGTELTGSAMFAGRTFTVRKQNDTTYAVRIPAIKASQLGNEIVVKGQAEGDFTITVSALSYVRAVLNSSKFSDEAKNTVSALYKYYEKTKALIY